jgi:hypothetical protein
VTSQRPFGPAFTVLLCDRKLFDRAAIIRDSSDFGYAKIKDGSQSQFWRRGYDGLEQPWFRERVLVLQSAGFLWHLVNEGGRKTSELPASVSLAGRG